MSKTKNNIIVKENSVIISVDVNFYALDLIYSAAYNFLDNAYVFLDGDPKNIIEVTLKGKENLAEKELKELAGEFFNELINVGVRDNISKNNKMIREYIVSAALIGASKELQEKIEKKSKEIENEKTDKDEWKDDPLGIGLTWEEQYENSGEKEDKE